MNITALGIDLAKNVFELYGVDKQGEEILTKRRTCGKKRLFVRISVTVNGMTFGYLKN